MSNPTDPESSALSEPMVARLEIEQLLGDILLFGSGFRLLAAFVFIKLLKDCFG
jgi:hypothetical protein